jgi:acetyltransferase-like isoleucine patch superfamily enzyme
VKIEAPFFGDDSAIVGYMPVRSVLSLDLRIGKNATIRSGSVIYLGSKIGENFATGHNVIVREQVSIGDSVQIWTNSIVDYRVTIGNRAKIHSNCYIAQLTIIKDGVFLAPGVVVANDKFPAMSYSEDRLKGAVFEKEARVGVNATILPGVRIGEGALIGAGAVVTKDVPPRSIAYGVPARVHGRMAEST